MICGKLPLFERKAQLKKIIAETDIQFSESFEVDGKEMYQARLQDRSRRRRLKGPRQPLQFGSQQRLGQENMRAARDAADRRASRSTARSSTASISARRKGDELIYAGKVDHGFTPHRQRICRPAKAADPENAALQQEDRAPRHLGRARRCWPRSSTGQSRPKARCGIRSSRACGRTCNEPSESGLLRWAEVAIIGSKATGSVSRQLLAIRALCFSFSRPCARADKAPAGTRVGALALSCFNCVWHVQGMETDMRRWIYMTGITLSLAVFGAAGPAGALPGGFLPTAVPTNVEQVQFFFGGRNYCWYDDGWQGPGFYWCGYAWRRGIGWGGGAGWHGWHGGHRGGHGGHIGIGGGERRGVTVHGGGARMGGGAVGIGGGHGGGHRGGGGHGGGHGGGRGGSGGHH